DVLLVYSYSIDDIINGLNNYSDKLFINNTGLNKKYDFHIKIRSSEEIINSLISYGLKVRIDKKEIEYIKIE
ncbi:MAG: hypothetical protein SFU99_13620, partial [Saprospiraceae bacterium]|nr:hypothetical protein [Saprospiraceae bacterium]